MVTTKLDGISILCGYIDGKFSSAYTRGDGVEGRNVTRKVQYFIPNTVDYDKEFYVRGEVLLDNIGFIEINNDKIARGEVPFKNKRNAVAGIMSRQDTLYHEYLFVIFYELVDSEYNDDKEFSRLEYMNHWGLPTVDRLIFDSINLNEEKLTTLLKEIKENRDYDIDGLVLTRENSIRENVKYPKNKVAFKVNEDLTECEVIDVVWETGRTGKVTPVVHIKPVDIQGVTVSKISGFNYKFIHDNKIGKGAIVGATRSGDVIPVIFEVFKPSDHFNIERDKIYRCSSCSSVLQLNETGVDMYCINPNCSIQQLNKTEYFLRTIGVEGISKVSLEKLGVETIYDFYDLTDEKIVNVPGFGRKKANSILMELQKSLDNTVDRETLLCALGIKGVGKEISKLLIDRFLDPEVVLTTPLEKLIMVEGVGEIVATNISDASIANLAFLDWFRSIGFRYKEPKKNHRSNAPKKVLSVAMTGKGEFPRKHYEEIITLAGHKVSKSVTKSTDILVSNSETSSKAKKAEQNGTMVIKYEDLEKYLKEV